jgi:hypothetical protein
VPGPGLNAIKILPPITLTSEDIQFFVDSLDDTIANMYARTGGPVVALSKAVVKDAVKNARERLPLMGNAGDTGVSAKKLPPD